ncbi:MAG: CRTAC1 family protein, partial [Acidobacteriota bacterium]|nr:CRTAC1 family protein [Acidobacteriota bacterium]
VALLGGCAGEDPGPTAPPPPAAPAVAPWLVDVSRETGLDFAYDPGGTGELHLPEIMGSGVGLFDYDNDGDLDLYLTNGNHDMLAPEDPDGPSNRLLGQEADGRWTDVTEESGLGDRGYGMGMAIGDTDNDGDLDVYVTNLGPDRFYRNRGDGTFENATAAAGIEVDGWSSSAAFFDYDRDGFLDLYVVEYVDYDPDHKCYDNAGRPDYCGPKEFRPVHDVLLHNDGDGTFTDVSKRAGMSSIAAAGLGVVCEDLDRDGLPDIYVANDAYANQLWINQGDGTFVDKALLLGAAVNLHGQAEAGMGVIAADFDHDGRSDLFVTHLGIETNTLYRNLGGDRGFADSTGDTGLGPSSMPYTGFGTAAFDVELDGDLDIAVANGRVVRGEPYPNAGVPPPWDIFAEPNLFYLNDGRGRFTPGGPALDAFVSPVEISRGIAVGDIDRDGDVDLIVSNIESGARIYRNDSPRGGHWLRVRAVDPGARRAAIGAEITVTADAGTLVRTVTRGFSYQSSSEPVVTFGVGGAETVDVRVRWPDGLEEVFPAQGVDRELKLTRGTGQTDG